MKKRILSMLLAICFVVTLLPSVAMAKTTFTDMPNDYSTTALEAAVANGLYNGSNGKIMPNDNLTRAQMAAIISRAFGTTQQASLTEFTDVSESTWYFEDIGKAVHMKVLNGYDGLMRPDDPISREEAFAVLARALKLKEGKADSFAPFSDKENVSDWAVGTTAAMIENGYVHGADGKIKPTDNIKRKDFAVLMDNIIKNYISTAGVVTEVQEGSVMINVPGVTLKDVTVKGNLIIGDGVGSGEVTLNNVKVEGKTIVRGGGVNSIIIKGNSSIGEIVISKVDGNVRVAVEGNAAVEIVEITDGKDDVIVEGNIEKVNVATSGVPVSIQNAAVKEVSIVSENAEVTVAKTAKVETVTTKAENTSLTVNGSVKAVNATESAAGAKVEVSKGATVDTVNAAAEKTEIKGEGSVNNANVTADNVKVDTAGTKLEVEEGVTGTTSGGKDIEGGTNTTTEGQNPSGDNDGGGGGYVPTPTYASVDVIAAGLHDQSENGLKDEDLFDEDSYVVNGQQRSDRDYVEVAITAKNLAAHKAADGAGVGYWVGVGIPAPEAANIDKATAKAGWGESNSDELNSIDGVKDGTITEDKKTYYTFYFNAGGANAAANSYKGYVTIDWDGEGKDFAPKVYELDMSKVSIKPVNAKDLEVAIDAANNGNTILVNGELNNALKIDKPITLKGNENATLAGGISITAQEKDAITLDNFNITKPITVNAKQSGAVNIKNNNLTMADDNAYGTTSNKLRYIVKFITDSDTESDKGTAFNITLDNNTIGSANKIEVAPAETVAFIMNDYNDSNFPHDGSTFNFTNNKIYLNALHTIYNIKASNFVVNGNTFMSDGNDSKSTTKTTALTAYNGKLHGTTTVTNNSFTGYGYAVKCTQYDSQPAAVLINNTVSKCTEGNNGLLNVYYAMSPNGLATGVNANADVVRVLRDITVSDDLTIPANAKVEINSGKTLTVAKDATLTVQEGATLTVQEGATLAIKEDASLNLIGSMVSEDGAKLKNNGGVIQVINEAGLRAACKFKSLAFYRPNIELVDKITLNEDLEIPQHTTLVINKKLTLSENHQLKAPDNDSRIVIVEGGELYVGSDSSILIDKSCSLNIESGKLTLATGPEQINTVYTDYNEEQGSYKTSLVTIYPGGAVYIGNDFEYIGNTEKSCYKLEDKKIVAYTQPNRKLALDITSGNVTLQGKDTLESGDSLFIRSGATFTITSDAEIVVEQGAGIYISEGGTLINNGKLTNNGTFNNSGTFTDNGTATGISH